MTATVAAQPRVSIEENDAATWDAFVAAAAGATHAHLFGWLTAFAAQGHETIQLVARDRDGAIAGVLPLVWLRSTLFGRFLVSMPVLDTGGPVGAPSALEPLAYAAQRLAQSGRADLLELRTRERGADAGLTTTERKLTVTLPLPPNSAALWQALPSKLRSQVRRPQNAGYTARFGPAERHAFHGVYSRHMRDLGSPAQGSRLFDVIGSALREHVEFVVVYDAAGQPAAAGCGFAFRDTFTLVWASALRRANADAPNMLLYWSAMERAIARGLSIFDFGRCSPGSGTHRFKRQWGGVDVPLPYLQWSRSGRVSPPQANETRYRIAGAVWRRLPLPVTNLCGPHVARLIP